MPEEKRRIIGRAPIRPDRIRSIAGQGFAFIPNGFLRLGFFVSLTPNELRLYVLLVLAADRNGLSFYHYDTLCSLLELRLDDYINARDALIAADLVAYDGTRFQVLSLPSKNVPTQVRAPVTAETKLTSFAPHCKGSPERTESLDRYREILSALGRRKPS